MYLGRHTQDWERCVTARQRCHESHSCSILPSDPFPASQTSLGSNPVPRAKTCPHLKQTDFLVVDFSFPASLSSSSDHWSFNWRWCEGGGLITPDGAAINLERREEVLDTSALGPRHTLLVVLCHRAAIAAKEYVFQHHVERGVLDTFALD